VKLLRRYGLTVEDVWAGSQSLRHKMEGASVPKGLSKNIRARPEQIQKMLTQLGKQIAKLDPTLKRTVERAKQRIEFHLDKLRRKAGKAQDQKTGLISAHEQYFGIPSLSAQGAAIARIVSASVLARWGASGLSETAEARQRKKSGVTSSFNYRSATFPNLLLDQGRPTAARHPIASFLLGTLFDCFAAVLGSVVSDGRSSSAFFAFLTRQILLAIREIASDRLS